MSPFQSMELVNRHNVNLRVSEANSKFDSIDGKFPVSVANGGTGGTTEATACYNLGICNSGVSASGSTESEYIANVQSYFSNYRKKQVPMFYSASWTTRSTRGVALGITPTTTDKSFLFIFNEATGPKFRMMTDTGTWIDYSPTGTVLYENSSGTAGTVTLSDSAANYKKIIIHYRDNNGYYKTVTVDDPNGKSISMEILWHRIGNTNLYLKVEQALITGSSIEIAGNKGQTRVGNNTSIVENGGEYILIWKVVGYKY